MTRAPAFSLARWRWILAAAVVFVSIFAPRESGVARDKIHPHLAKSAAKPSAAPPREPADALHEKTPAEPPPPYDTQLLRLAEILGGLSYLSDLCGGDDGDEWRGKMAQLRDAEAPTGPRRQKLNAAFNRGFRGYELTYRVCTPNARLVIARYLGEADRLSRDLTARFGEP